MDAWNVLPDVLEEADTIVAFKGILERHKDMQGREGCG